jgi:acyl dehydratase
MAITYPDVLNLRTEGVSYSWSDREVMLYALGIGLGNDPLDEKELLFVNEGYFTRKPLKVVPTFASVCVWGASPGQIGFNRVMSVDGERDIIFHKPMPATANVHAMSRVAGIFDKGKDKGVVVRLETTVSEAGSGDRLATIATSIFARADGGFGGPSDGQPEPHSIPKRAPDKSVDIETRPHQALIYRLSGDRNPLHSDPEFAKRAGFPGPILHGMCTYGITCRGVLQTYADYDPTAFKRHAARFSSPVFPGDTVTVDLWKDGNIVSFEARVKARNVTVVRNGRTELG